MKKFIIASIAFMALSQSAFALLSPLNQSIVEIRTLLDDPRLQQAISSGEDIQDVMKTSGGYMIITDSYHLQVDVEYAHQNKIGPAKFTLNFHTPISNQSDSK